MKALACVCFALVASACFAQAPDVTGLYDVTSEGSSQKVKVGQKGTLMIAFRTKSGAHISPDAPMKIELSAKEAKLGKASLTLADNVAKKVPGQEHVDPKFEVPFTIAAAGRRLSKRN